MNAARRWKVKGEPRKKTYKRGPLKKVTGYQRGQIVAELRDHPIIEKIYFDPLALGRENTFEFQFKTQKRNYAIVSPQFKAALEHRGYSVSTSYFETINSTDHNIRHGQKFAAKLSTKVIVGNAIAHYLVIHEAHVEPILSELLGGQQLQRPKRRRK